MKKILNKKTIVTACLFFISAITLFVVFNTRQSSNMALKEAGLAKGWQLKLPPAEALKAGTIYRVNKGGYFYRVKTLTIPSAIVNEGGFTYTAKVLTTRNIVAAFLRIGEVGSDLNQEIKLTLELNNVVREITDDDSVDEALNNLWDKVRIRPDEKYYIIRETRAASQIYLHLAKEEVNGFGGEAKIKGAANVHAAIKEGEQGSVIIQDEYKEQMYIMYLPEEIKLLTAGFDNNDPEFGLFQVQEALEWRTAID